MRAGVELAYRSGKPVVVLKGVSLMGVPLPNAWLGGVKNIDLVQELGAERGFWKAFAEGVEDVRVEDGRLQIKLKEQSGRRPIVPQHPQRSWLSLLPRRL